MTFHFEYFLEFFIHSQFPTPPHEEMPGEFVICMQAGREKSR